MKGNGFEVALEILCNKYSKLYLSKVVSKAVVNGVSSLKSNLLFAAGYCVSEKQEYYFNDLVRFYEEVVDLFDIDSSCQYDIFSVYSCFNCLLRYKSVGDMLSSEGAAMIVGGSLSNELL
ncbi:hypothetical protein [Desulfovibrio subterraneus]|uniref:Uncharacterized protein n=1 Tax=Desulfovibrio subterraneus TaxID=2718620 RepID=A0A7J0BNB9_9BACT|nr:hypothetical protein [Desulfovibrio subterraneus]GFM35180.1 hypothetical protein DSM101010T_35450 [Desulfovibrio subterraneus]